MGDFYYKNVWPQTFPITVIDNQIETGMRRIFDNNWYLIFNNKRPEECNIFKIVSFNEAVRKYDTQGFTEQKCSLAINKI